jgi:hypothetical protein
MSLPIIGSSWDSCEDYAIRNDDCIPTMLEGIEPQSVDLAVFSPPLSPSTRQRAAPPSTAPRRAASALTASHAAGGRWCVVWPG